mgnify:CR=1 FL=1
MSHLQILTTKLAYANLISSVDEANPWAKEEHIMSVVIIGGHDRMVRQYKENL